MPENNTTTVTEETAAAAESAAPKTEETKAPAAEAAPKVGKKHIIVDPITRIEGHLRIEAIIDENNKIVDAWSSSTMFRGIETILKGRDPRDCGLMAMRICGVCTGTHYQRSIEAVEDAFKITIPKNARLVRNLIQGALYVHDHLVHFYHLHALDFVDVVSATKANPTATAAEAQKWADVAGHKPSISGAADFKAVQDRIVKFVKEGRLGIFGNGYWGNPHYKLTPEQNLIGVAHYLKALDIQRDMAKMQAIFGGKNPHPQSIVVGGVTCVQDIKNPARIALFKQLLQESNEFIKGAYLPDIYMAGTMYADEATDKDATLKGVGGTGGGILSYMSYGDFRLDDTGFYNSEMLFPSGLVLDGDISKALDVDPNKITEDVTHSWYEGTGAPEHPYEGTTIPKYTGLEKKADGYSYLKTEEKYSWIKSPLYDGKKVEVGPLARMVIGYVKGDKRITKYVGNFLKRANLPVTVLFSTVGRTAARAIETELMGDVMMEWVDELAKNAASGDLSTWTEFDFDKVSVDTKGMGLAEAPRGSLGHWVKVKNGKVENYQAVVPSTWNAGPRGPKGEIGAYEGSLIGTKVANPEEPLEIIRTIHSFDPCIACAVHVVDTKGKELAVYKVDPTCAF
ncbi:nickel-dependent hydrogenase large subunit [Sulfurovum sp. NBC37-1]|uniref:nickel-dependent hydrogenase large subunit n=1 Tax=Sulfurovum sp. (strain NBC37-1) TaxID=387093 RepID=UPI0001587D1F|nr:nickel-dependent hydrogenase large subunit [Sulfurovum sp. NBC37-1]BAF72612.1 Ni-Fe hydrogenase, large subunit [Sulfurovum sp. NBC37-1]